MRFEVFGVQGIPEVGEDDDIAALIVDALSRTDEALHDGDIVVVTSKIVSKAEGRVIAAADREAAIDAEAVRTVADWVTPRGRTRVVETRHGLVLAAAGVDASNVEAGHVVLLPVDPNESARRIRSGLADAAGANIGVIITDTAGRVWRQGVTDIAIGAAGVRVLDDLRGQVDEYGNELGVTMVAVADELAAASELVRGKLAGVPAAVVRGMSHLVTADGTDGAGAAQLIRPSAEDRFRLGTPEAMRAAVLKRRDVSEFRPDPVDPAIVHPAIGAAKTGPAMDGPADLHFVLVESATARKAVVDSLERSAQAAADVVDRAPGLIAVYGTGNSPMTAAAGVENMLIALAAEGIGSTWLTVSQPLGLDVSRGMQALGIVAYGHPHDSIEPAPAHEPVKEITHV